MAMAMMLSGISVSAATSVAGTVYDTDYDGISDATVKVSNSGGLLGEGTTNYRGKFDISLNSDISGEVIIEASKSGYITGRQTKTLENGINLDDIEFVLASGSVRLNISVVGTASSWDYLSNVHCTVRLNDNTVAEGDTFYGSVSLTVNDVVETGAYSITLSKSGYQTLTKPLTLVPGEDQTLSYTLYKDGENPPAETSTIKGNVYSQDDGWNGVAGADVSLLDGEKPIGTAKTDDEGDFTITIDGILNGDYTLKVEKEGYETYSATVNFTNGKASNQDINLSRQSTEATITGLITADPTGSLVDGAEVQLYCDETLVATAETFYGQYNLKISNPEDGSYVLKVDAESYEPYSSEPFTVKAGQSLTINASLVKKEVTEITTVKGIVKDQYGNNVGGVKVTLCKGETTEDYEFTDLGGEFEFSIKRKLDGEFILNTERYNYSKAAYPITITDGTAPYAEIAVICQTADIIVSLSDADSGAPITDATVTILLGDEKKGETEHNETGSYTVQLECVTGSDTYKITAEAEGYDIAETESVLTHGENNISLKMKARKDGIASVEAGGSWAVDGRTIKLFAENSARVEIYSVDGRLIATGIVDGSLGISLDPGIYIVRFGSSRFTLSIR